MGLSFIKVHLTGCENNLHIGLKYTTQGRFVIEIYITGHTNDNTQL